MKKINVALLTLGIVVLSAPAAHAASAETQKKVVTGLSAVAMGFSMLADSDLQSLSLLGQARIDLASAAGCEALEKCQTLGAALDIDLEKLKEGPVGLHFAELEDSTGITPERLVAELKAGKTLGQIFVAAPEKGISWSAAQVDSQILASALMERDLSLEVLDLGDSKIDRYLASAAPAEEATPASAGAERSVFELIHSSYERRAPVAR